MQEQTFLNEHGVTVTNARFVVASQTYAIAGITSVKSYYQGPNHFVSLIILMFGVFGCLYNLFLGLLGVGLGVFVWRTEKPTFQILLSTSGGEVKALVSYDKQHIDKVVLALNDAIVARG